MEHEVYISYDEDDKNTADAVCHALEENKIKCWIKPRDLGVGHIVEECMESIRNSKVVVLIFSESSKESNFVNTEINMAFENRKPILVFSVDDSELDGGLKFFLQGQHWLDAYPNPEIEFRQLIVDTSKLLGMPISEPELKDAPKLEPKETKKKVEKIQPPKSNTKFIILAVAIILVAAIAFFVFGGTGNVVTESPIDSMEITDVVVEDHTGEYSTFNYTYKIKGKMEYHLNDTDDYEIISELYDSTGTMLDTYSIDLSKAPYGEEFNMGGGLTDEANVTKVVVKVVSPENETLKQAEKQV